LTSNFLKIKDYTVLDVSTAIYYQEKEAFIYFHTLHTLKPPFPLSARVFELQLVQFSSVPLFLIREAKGQRCVRTAAA